MIDNIRYRNELKYLCSAAELEIIRKRLQSIMKYDVHANHGHYSVRSMYFDNYGNQCYYENENGTDPREKFRIRIYNADSRHMSLECKRKEHGKTSKTSCSLSMKEYNDLLCGGRIDSLPDKPCLLRKFSVLMNTQLFHPSVIVEYERTAFVCPIGNVRITLDQNIRSSDAFNLFFSERLPARQILPKGQSLLEVKYDVLLPDFIKETLELGSLQNCAFSKYYLCKKHSMGGSL